MFDIHREMIDTDDSICQDEEVSGLLTKLPESRQTLQSEEIFHQKSENAHFLKTALATASLQTLKQQRTETRPNMQQFPGHFNFTSEFQINNQ